MPRVYISGLDTPLGHNISLALAAKNLQETSIDPKALYQIYGSYSSTVKDGRQSRQGVESRKERVIIPSGNIVSDSNRRKAIQKIPIAGLKPQSVIEWLPTTKNDQIKGILLSSGIIVLDLLSNLDEAKWAVETLYQAVDVFDEPKTIIMISSVITWAKTLPSNPADDEFVLAEDEYRRRKAHPNFAEHLKLEKLLTKYAKHEKFNGYIIASGLIYHGGDSLFHHLFKAAWLNEPNLICYGKGQNYLPCVHLDDLVRVIVDVIESVPDVKYIVAVDDSQISLKEITKAIAETLSNGLVREREMEDAFLDPFISQQKYDLINMNMKFSTGYIKKAGIALEYADGLISNIDRLVQEYRDSHGLQPLNIVIHGPPASGKSTIAKKIATQYRIHYLEPQGLARQSIKDLELKVFSATNEDSESNSDKVILDELKLSMQENAGILPSSQTIRLLRDKINSKECMNQGYIIDGAPTSIDEANELFKPIEDCANQILPEFVFTIELSDHYIKKRILKLSEEQLAAANYTEESIRERLEGYRKRSTDDITVLNFFDELEINPSVLQSEYLDDSQIMASIIGEIGDPRNYGASAEQIIEERIAAEALWIKSENLANDERIKVEQNDAAKRAKTAAEWSAKIEEVRKQEKELLEAQSEPLRDYLVKYILPILTAGLVEVAKIRPDDPIDYLAEFLLKASNSDQLA